jgi:hypothetical protein
MSFARSRYCSAVGCSRSAGLPMPSSTEINAEDYRAKPQGEPRDALSCHPLPGARRWGE